MIISGNMLPPYIGLSGTNASGKDSAGNILSQEFNYLFVSVTDILRQELKKQKLSFSRENMRSLSAEWRRVSGNAFLIDKAVDLFSENTKDYVGLVMASLRNPSEADRVHALGGVVIWLDGDPRTRYDRLQANLALRGANRSVNDQISFQQFLAEEEAEMYRPSGGDSATLSLIDVKKKADIFIENNTNDLADLTSKLQLALGVKV